MSLSSRKGFTVIELLVAVGVTALMVTLMISIVTNVLSSWNRTSGILSSGNQARLVFDQIAQDLQGAIFKRDGNVWLAASLQQKSIYTGMYGEVSPWPANAKPDADTPDDEVDDSLRINPDGLDLNDYRFGQAGVWLRFFTIPISENVNDVSAPRAVSYQMVRRRIGGNESKQYSYQLYRGEADSDTTFQTGYNLFASGTPYNLQPSSATGQATNVRSPTPDQVIANNVVDFGVRLFAENTGVDERVVEVFPVDRRGGVGAEVERMTLAATSDSTLSDPVNGENTAYVFPVYAEIMLRILTPEGVRLIEAKEDPETGDNIPQTWWEIVEQHSQIYTRRVDLKSLPL